MKKTILSVSFLYAYLFSIQAQTLYGLTRFGGSKNQGTIIKFMPGSNTLTVGRSFEDNNRYPGYSNFIQATNGNLYHTATDGTNKDYGAIFSFNPSNSTYSRLKTFDKVNGAYPGELVQAGDGKLYGMTWQGGNNNLGVIFSFNPVTSAYSKLYDFDYNNGTNPSGSLVLANNGKLYGITREGGSNGLGVIFSFDPSNNSFSKLMDFDGIGNGAFPDGSLTQASDGKLYGMASSGGSSQNGVIFSIDPSSSNFAKLYDFDYVNGASPHGKLVQASNGKMYSVTMEGGSFNHGVIFSFHTSTKVYAKLMDFNVNNSGAYPIGTLALAGDGKLYGATIYGSGTYPFPGYGFLFSFDPASNTYTKLRALVNANESQSPFSNMVYATDGKLYGISNFGVIFSFQSNDATYTTLVDLNVNDGSDPFGSLVQASDGKLYGVAADGGSGRYPDGGGGIFSYDPFTSMYTKLVDFTGYTNGSKPYGSLVQASNGKLYGMTWGGSYYDSWGVIYSFDPSTSAFTKVKSFNDGFSQYPFGNSLMQASNGKLYGMTSGNVTGSNSGGTIFSFDLSTSVYSKLVDFTGPNGGYPTCSLIQASDGKLYGMTTAGGRNGLGVIFSYDPSTSNYRKLEDFDGTNGAYPYGISLVQATDGKLYGMTNGGGNNDLGTIFTFDLQKSKLTKLRDFDSTNGAHPTGSLMQASNGKLYGMTNSGGSSNLGVIFSFDPASSAFTKMQDFDSSHGARPSFGGTLIELKGGVLPTTIVSFSGKNKGAINQLDWKVSHEQGVSYYELQAGKDATHFNSNAKISAAGNDQYTYDDPINTSISTTWFYRLKIIDKDGSFKYSTVLKIDYNKSISTQFTVAPNPVYNSCNISFNLPQSERVLIQMVDASGITRKLLANDRFEKGYHSLKLNTSNIPAGTYFLRFDTATYSETKKLTVSK